MGIDTNINKAADRNVTNDDINNESVSIDDFWKTIKKTTTQVAS